MHTRHLAQEGRVLVSTPMELEEAILEGRSHIVITSHLDMTSMPLRQTAVCDEGCASPLPEIHYAISIRVSTSLCPTRSDPHISR